MDRNQVTHINLAYFGVADPAYYGIDCTYMGGTTIPGVTPAMMRPPRLPGYVAVSVTLLDGVPFAERDRDFYKPLRDRHAGRRHRRVDSGVLGGKGLVVKWAQWLTGSGFRQEHSDLSRIDF